MVATKLPTHFCENLTEATGCRTYKVALLAKWRSAILAAAELTSWRHDTSAESLPDLVRKVSVHVERRLAPQPRDMAGTQIGLEATVNELLAQLHQGSGVHTLGLTGMGGIGKTTLATALYNRLREGFTPAVCFVADVRARAATPTGAQGLQHQMLKQLWHKEATIRCSGWLAGCRVLLVLDDVDDDKGWLGPLVDISCFAPGSVVIVTSRDARALDVAGCCVRSIDLLASPFDLQLFLFHAGSIPPEVTDDLLSEVVQCCGRLPLSLKVLGAHLKGRTVLAWSRAMTWLRGCQPLRANGENLWERLRISYDSLDDDAQQQFLDISFLLMASLGGLLHRAMFRNHDVDSFDTLTERHLVDVDAEGRLSMHDHLRDMGPAIEVRNMGPHPTDGAARRRLEADEAFIMFKGTGV
ncbi:hypothetical protein WJX72_000248 [[Myrmecia] bisecta]|uniref:NB-ARC domain-containing protein n=1 Tax=[Myrmecia] bisecta TaxID=41462 RepID=A0AAW1Q4F1_9CHLO